MLSKELLGKLFKFEKIKNNRMIKNTSTYRFDGMVLPCEYIEREINVNELANKCKEWANKNDLYLLSGLHTDLKHGKGTCYIFQTGVMPSDMHLAICFISDTEPEAIFKACEWILEQQND